MPRKINPFAATTTTVTIHFDSIAPERSTMAFIEVLGTRHGYLVRNCPSDPWRIAQTFPWSASTSPETFDNPAIAALVLAGRVLEAITKEIAATSLVSAR